MDESGSPASAGLDETASLVLAGLDETASLVSAVALASGCGEAVAAGAGAVGTGVAGVGEDVATAPEQAAPTAAMKVTANARVSLRRRIACRKGGGRRSFAFIVC